MGERRQVWDVTKGRAAGGSISRDLDGEPYLVYPLTKRNLADLITGGGLIPRRADACQDPVADLIERRPVVAESALRRLKAI